MSGFEDDFGEMVEPVAIVPTLVGEVNNTTTGSGLHSANIWILFWDVYFFYMKYDFLVANISFNIRVGRPRPRRRFSCSRARAAWRAWGGDRQFVRCFILLCFSIFFHLGFQSQWRPLLDLGRALVELAWTWGKWKRSVATLSSTLSLCHFVTLLLEESERGQSHLCLP